ncbi:MAG TPA: GNAT family N-acetyltransferase [Gaiellaceae bacterium]|nr:GNAT family N-acetyltransferase [Gaiellaceae bacterium]
MRIRELDAAVAAEAELLAVHALEEACAPPGEPFREPELSLAYYRHWPAGDVRRRWLADDEGGPPGAAALMMHGLAFVYVDIVVHPERRRRGVGSALLEKLCDAAREHGAHSFFGHHWTAAGAAFAAHVGARDDQRDVRAVLDLRSAELPDPVVPAGWRLLSWVGTAPDELVESFARARDAMNDAPSPDGVQAWTTTVDEVRQAEEAASLRGREVRVTVALDERDEIVAFTDVRATPGSAAAATDDTAVVAAARGHGLGRAVKLESLRRLRAERPEVETVSTMNAEHNAAMRHINTSIGFVPTSTLTTTVLMLDERPA